MQIAAAVLQGFPAYLIAPAQGSHCGSLAGCLARFLIRQNCRDIIAQPSPRFMTNDEQDLQGTGLLRLGTWWRLHIRSCASGMQTLPVFEPNDAWCLR